MVWKLLKHLLGLLFRSGMSFLYFSISRAMSCIFGCLGIRNRYRSSRSNNLSDSSLSKRKVPVSQNQLVSLFLSEENEDCSIKDADTTYFQSPTDVKELNSESYYAIKIILDMPTVAINKAKFLKACGTITETPAEIRKASQKLHGSSLDEDSEHLKCHSWLPHSIETLQLDHPPTPLELSQKQEKGLSSSGCTPYSKQNSPELPVYSDKAYESPCANATATDIHCRSKSVRFECPFNESSPGRLVPDKVSRNGMKSHYNPSGSKQSPYPTPLRLSDEMQTPGTVFPSNFVNIINGKTQIRSQFVRSVMNPVEGDSQSIVLKDYNNFDGLSAESKGSIVESENPSRISEVLGKDTEPTPKKLETFSNRSKCEGTPGDRPIIGMVAAHWNEDEPTNISPKLWDGNGIPNSTNKYKEDQKVSWHATPFEQRLEKALSEESSSSQRIFHGKSTFSNEDSDTALSALQTETHPNYSSFVLINDAILH